MAFKSFQTSLDLSSFKDVYGGDFMLKRREIEQTYLFHPAHTPTSSPLRWKEDVRRNITGANCHNLCFLAVTCVKASYDLATAPWLLSLRCVKESCDIATAP
ncbi:hypothetical protein RRG08_044947 [Elysia crispata]|uniref:Uncharacterized protein n=1 Tax=Elysia crispata TaxID=231223 RepID=A0AAE0ZUR4_9GAST|nr:hypothetical protein RRG08_044947 [Elysia crispata]